MRTKTHHINWNRVLIAALGLTLLDMVNVGTAASPGAGERILPAALPESGVNPLITPGDDFFAYANGEWLDETGIPHGKVRWGARNEIDATTKRQVADVIMKAVSRRADETERKVADFYSAWLDEKAIESRGKSQLTSLLEDVGKIRDRAALANWLGSNLPACPDPLTSGVYDSEQLFGLSVGYGIHGETMPAAYLVQGGLGLTEREPYLDEAATMRERRAGYQRYIARLLELAGFDRAAERAASVVALEIEMARSHATPEASAPDQNADHRWTRDEFASQAPGLDWPTFFAAAGLMRQKDFVVWQPDAIRGAAALAESKPLAVWQDYLRFHIIDRYADVLPRAFADAALEFRGATPGATRAQRASEATNGSLPLAVGRLYVQTYFPFEKKAYVRAILTNVLDAFRRRLDGAPWMTAASKSVAMAKLDALYFGVGYPDKWPDDSRLSIDRSDALGNLRRVAEWNYHNTLAKLERPLDRFEWSITPQSAGGTLNFLQNSYNFSAGLLQPPKFDPDASEAANYGAIGAILGHEISHFVDTLGADYDARGASVRWWTDADKQQYEAAARSLELQFGGYHPFPDVSIDGHLTASENVADLAGLMAAFDAHRRVLGSRAENREYLRQQDRQFFLGFARAYRAKFTSGGLRTQSLKNDHAPEMFRVSTVRNLDAWYDAFDVRPGQRLYLEPQARVRIW